jgi:O-antigen ligase
MHKAVSFFKHNSLVIVFFTVLSGCLLLGDGKQSIIDIVGASLTLALFVIAHIYLPKQRSLSSKSVFLWTLLLLYYIGRTVFSDDIGYSFFSTLRLFDACLLYIIWYSYSTFKTNKVLIVSIQVFAILSIVVALICTLFPSAFNFLPSMNLLFPLYGHNPVVNIIMFAYPISFASWFLTKNDKYLFLVAFFVLSTSLSFARQALFFETAIGLMVCLCFVSQKKNIRKTWFISTVLIAISLFFFFLPYNRIQSNQELFPQRQKTQNLIESRMEYWRQATLSIKENILFGTGPGTFSLNSKKYQSFPERYSWFAHSFPLEVASETGFIGFVIFGSLIYVLISESLGKISETKEKIALLSTVMCVFLYSFFDYSMNYIVVWFMFWICLGSLGGYSTYQKTKGNTLYIWFLVAFIVFGYVTSVITRFSPIYYLDIDKTVSNLKNNPSDKFALKLASVFHKKNATAFFAEGKIVEAIKNDPQNIEYLKEYLKYIGVQPKDQYGLLLMQGASLIYNVSDDSKAAGINSINHSDIEWAKLIEYIGYSQFPNEIYAKAFYYIGLQNMKRNSENTKDLWILATNISPGWGHFWVELSNFEYNQNDISGAKQTLFDCQKHEFPKKQCQTSPWPPLSPGDLKEKIKAIPAVL